MHHNLVLPCLSLVLLLLDRLQEHLFLSCKVLLWDSELEQGAEVLGEVAEEDILVFCVLLRDRSELLILGQCHVLRVVT